MRRGQRLGYLRPCTETRINQPVRLQPVERLLIEVGSFRLNDWFTVDGKSQPGEVLEDAGDEFGAAAAGIEILDPEAEPASAGARMGMADHCRKCMAKVQPAGGRRRETCDLQDSLLRKADKSGT